MRSYSLASLTFLLAPLGCETSTLKFPLDLPSSLSLESFNSILLTETRIEFGSRRLAADVSEQLWTEALAKEWNIAEQREETASGGRRRVESGQSRGLSPFVVCDVEFGKHGENCMSSLRSLLGSDMIPIYNKRDMSCFVLEALPSEVQNLPENYVAVPMSVEMKIQEGLSDSIALANPNLRRFQCIFCPGEALDIEEGTFLAQSIVDSIMEQGGRRLGVESFLPNRESRDPDRLHFWNRQLKTPDDVTCEELFGKLTIEVTAEGDTMTLSLQRQDITAESAGCLQALILVLASEPEICFVGGYQDVTALNTVASSIVQSGNKNERPFNDVGLNGEGQIVAVSDSGIDTDNCYFWDAQNAVPKDTSGNYDHSVRKVVQYYAFGDTMDQTGGHGTHVAASIVGRKAEDGITESDGEDGVAKAAKVAFFDLGETLTNTMGLPSSFFTLFGEGYEAGARIHSASWGTDSNLYTTMDRATDAYMRQYPDFLFVVAAGNMGDGNAENTVGSPATCKNGITVGASLNAQPLVPAHMQGPDYLAHFSSRGPTADGRLKPDVVAPGLYVKSASSVPDMVGECDDTTPSGLELKAGTSMAAPIVAGVAALVRQYFMEGWYPDGNRDPTRGFQPRGSLVKAVLLNGADTLLGIEESPGNIKDSDAYDIHQGFGRVNLISSLPLSGENLLSSLVVNAETIGNAGRHEYYVTIDEKSGCKDALSATLVWTDPDGSPFCADCVLNDLDLYITRDGVLDRYFPNGLSEPDSINNVERVRIDSPVDGEKYTIHVEGFELLGVQEYSLVVTGCFESNDVPDANITASGIPASQVCQDGRGDVMINNYQIEDCGWLSTNLDAYSYLCQFVEVASVCKATCGFCDSIVGPTIVDGDGPVQPTDSTFEGSYRWYGVTFDVKIEKDMTIKGMDIHTALVKDYNVQIFTRKGSLSDTGEEWSKIVDSVVQGKGEGFPTPIPEASFSAFKASPGEHHSFYIALEEPDLVIERSIDDAPIFENQDVVIRQGKAVTQSSGDEYPYFSWTGRIWYSLSNTLDAIPATCEDNDGEVLIDLYVGTESCQWLSDNFYRFQHACKYVETAVHCPKTCGVCYLVAP